MIREWSALICIQIQSMSHFQDQITGPTLILDSDIAKANIKAMANKIGLTENRLRPHFKTIQSAEIGTWFRKYDVKSCAVTNIDMAEYFADAGWEDIMIAMPVNLRQKSRLLALAAKVTLHIFVDCPEVVGALANEAGELGVWIELDIGDGRSGVDHEALDGIAQILDKIKETPGLRLEGLATHAGHSYQSRFDTELVFFSMRMHSRILQARYDLELRGYKNLKISYGDTPTCAVAELSPEIDEYRPGNFVFFDLMQVEIGSCQESDIAVALAAPVISIRPELGQVVVHGGAVHLSKDFLLRDEQKLFGKVVTLTEHGWKAPSPDVRVVSLSQEHGVIQGPEEWLNSLKIGDLIGILPVHSCLLADAMPWYLDTNGNKIEKFTLG